MQGLHRVLHSQQRLALVVGGVVVRPWGGDQFRGQVQKAGLLGLELQFHPALAGAGERVARGQNFVPGLEPHLQAGTVALHLRPGPRGFA